MRQVASAELHKIARYATLRGSQQASRCSFYVATVYDDVSHQRKVYTCARLPIVEHATAAYDCDTCMKQSVIPATLLPPHTPMCVKLHKQWVL